MYPIELITVLGAVGALISFLVQAYQSLKRKKRGEEETINRVQSLVTSLRETTELISDIEAEITARSALAEKLQRDIDRYNKLAELRKPEVEAVAQLLRGELVRVGKRSFWSGFAINFLFFILGAIASGIIAVLAK